MIVATAGHLLAIEVLACLDSVGVTMRIGGVWRMRVEHGELLQASTRGAARGWAW
jgi:hypothetical protein